ncbi:uncharacterized protein LOC108942244 isoform X2 [Scleropages formosus]|nr:uncharacterized protein LOC108942244 isoform X2 [Scleropages formosus]XP_018620936.1 uncharacterized protein LOC108942244 isoform X2 [Scleropages formosus]XP_029108196.1 uncharacterized protein LOC108942244 isoform X2 [Scleropages formosus]
MNILPQMLLCCCLLAAAVSIVDAAKLTWSSEKDRFTAWLVSRTRRTGSDGAQLDRGVDTEHTSVPQPSVRFRRSGNSVSPALRPACFLATCSVHILSHTLNDRQTKRSNAPPEKIEAGGYGRRRRSLPGSRHHGVQLRQT